MQVTDIVEGLEYLDSNAIYLDFKLSCVSPFRGLRSHTTLMFEWQGDLGLQTEAK
jgi:hypothetical protein